MGLHHCSTVSNSYNYKVIELDKTYTSNDVPLPFICHNWCGARSKCVCLEQADCLDPSVAARSFRKKPNDLTLNNLTT